MGLIVDKCVDRKGWLMAMVSITTMHTPEYDMRASILRPGFTDAKTAGSFKARRFWDCGLSEP